MKKLTLIAWLLCSVLLCRASAERYAASSRLAEGTWLKISVTETGIYCLNYSDLKKKGIDPSKAQVYGYGGALLAEDFTQAYIDDLPAVPVWRDESKQRLVFYAVGPCNWRYDSSKKMYVRTLNHYSTKGYYFVGESRETLLTPELQSVTAAAAETVTAYTEFRLHENDLYNIGKTGRECYGEDFSSVTSQTFSFDVCDLLSTETSKLLVDFAARNTVSSSLSVTLGETIAGTAVFSAISADNSYTYAFGGQVMKSFTPEEGITSLKIGLTYRPGNGTVKAAHLNNIQLNLRRALKMDGDVLLFRDPASVASGAVCRFAVENADARTIVLDVTDPLCVKQMDAAYSNGTLSFTADASSLKEYAAVRLDGSLTKVKIEGAVPNQDLHAAAQAELVIITAAEFIAQAEELAEAHRSHDGIHAHVFTAEEVYNEFSSGTPDATAYRRLMKMFYDRARSEDDRPQSLLLFGDGVYDNRMVTNAFRHASNPPAKLLVYESEESLEGTASFVSDDYFGFLDDNEGTRPAQDKLDIGVGRFPVRTTEEADIAVEKSIRYMNDTDRGVWKNTVCFLADDGDGNTHAGHANALADLLTERHPEFIADKIFVDAYERVSTVSGSTAPGAHTRFMDLLTSGLLMLNYSGHGSTTSWTAEGLLTIQDIRNMKNTRLPLWVTATCDFCRYDDAESSGGELVFLNANGGAAALVTTTRLVYSGPNFTLNKAFISNVFTRKNGRRPTLGEVMCLTKQSAELQNDRNKLSFALIGDPALKLGYPEYRAEVTAINGHSADPLRPDTAESRSLVCIEGEILDPDGERAERFNGYVYPTVFDAEVEAQTLGNEGNDPFFYTDRSNILYKGKATVRNGRFSFSFIVPDDQSYAYSNGLINLYACTESGPASDGLDAEAQGVFEDFILGGTKKDGQSSAQGPSIALYLNDTLYREGESVNATPTLIARLSDPDGLNTSGNGIGHDIVLTVDDGEPYILNDHYESDLNSYTAGSVYYPLPTLEQGEHSLTLKAWDMQNHSSVKGLCFTVDENRQPSVGAVEFFQSAEKAWFGFTHDRPQRWLSVTLTVYDLSGRLIWRQSTDMYNQTNDGAYIEWDYTGEGGRKVGNGLYICRLSAVTDEGCEALTARKIIVSTQ